MTDEYTTVKYGRKWIAGTWSNGKHGLLCLANWQWRSAQPGDRWVPKRGKHGTTVTVPNAAGTPCTFRCEPLIISQHHDADLAALCYDEIGRKRSIKWSALRRHWRPEHVRDYPVLVR